MTPAQFGTWPLGRSQLHQRHPQCLSCSHLTSNSSADPVVPASPLMAQPPACSPRSLYRRASFPAVSLTLFPLQPVCSRAPVQISSPLCATLSVAPSTLQSRYPTRTPSVLIFHTLLQVPWPRGSRHANSIPQGLVLLSPTPFRPLPNATSLE